MCSIHPIIMISNSFLSFNAKKKTNLETKSLGQMDLNGGEDMPYIDASLINLDRIVKWSLTLQ